MTETSPQTLSSEDAPGISVTLDLRRLVAGLRSEGWEPAAGVAGEELWAAVAVEIEAGFRAAAAEQGDPPPAFERLGHALRITVYYAGGQS